MTAQTKIIFSSVNKSDAKELVSWWNANSPYYHFYQKQTSSYKKGNLFNFIRQL